MQARYARKAVALDSRQPTDTPVSTTATAFATVATAPGRALQDLELESIRNALQACKGNVSLAAKQLNVGHVHCTAVTRWVQWATSGKSTNLPGHENCDNFAPLRLIRSP